MKSTIIRDASRELEENVAESLGLREAIRAAQRESGQSGLPAGPKGDSIGAPMDAYRHILISAEMTRQWGETMGAILGSAHEKMNELRDEQTGRDKDMDDHNNAIGVEIGGKAKTWADVVRMARKAIADGAKANGDGADGTASWYNKPKAENWSPNWSNVPVQPNAKGDAGNRFKGRAIFEAAEAAFDSAGNGNTEQTGNENGGKDAKESAPDDGAVSEMRAGVPNSSLDGRAREGGGGGTPLGLGRGGTAVTLDKLPLDGTIVTADKKPRDEFGQQVAIEEFLVKARQPGERLDELLLKRPAEMTEAEMREVMRSNAYWTPSDPQRGKAHALVAGWFQRHATDAPVQLDATGRPRETDFAVPPPRIEQPARDPRGRNLAEGVDAVGRRVAARALRTGLGEAVGRLQDGINLLNEKSGKAGRRLAVDGSFGPRTRDAARRAVADFGSARLETGLGLAGFRRLARERARGGGLDLATDFGDAFAPERRGDARPLRQAQALQSTLSGMGGGKLALDGAIGPRQWRPSTASCAGKAWTN